MGIGVVAPALLKLGTGIFSSIFGSRKSPEQKAAEQYMMQQLQRANQLWPQAQNTMNQAGSYYGKLAGGSRTAGMEAIAPDVQQAGERIDEVNQAQGRLAGRSGGATTDPYAKANLFTQMLLKARQGAVGGLMDVGKTYGSWAANEGAAAPSLFSASQIDRQNREGLGAGLMNVISSTFPSIWLATPWGKPKPTTPTTQGTYVTPDQPPYMGGYTTAPTGSRGSGTLLSRLMR